MPCISYVMKRFSLTSRTVIDQAVEIIGEYAKDGYDLTLRQLYYQFVSRDLLKNNVKNYKRLGSIINDARLAGLVDWNAITDRGRNLMSLSHWESPGDIVSACANEFRVDKWARQKIRVEVWIEKEALSGVFSRVCNELDIPYFACKGYTSQSEMWAAAMRFKGHTESGQRTHILHFGDHDPSGLDMTRDIIDRLRIFGASLDVHRLALNMDQIEEYGPPPNPAKETDARFAAYQEEFGDESWELDALEPQVLASLVRDWIDEHRDYAKWASSEKEESRGREKLREAAEKLS